MGPEGAGVDEAGGGQRACRGIRVDGNFIFLFTCYRPLSGCSEAGSDLNPQLFTAAAFLPYKLVCVGLCWSALVCFGLRWSTLVCVGLFWSALVYFGLRWSALVCFGLRWSVLVCVGLHWSALVCIGLLWSALVCIVGLSRLRNSPCGESGWLNIAVCDIIAPFYLFIFFNPSSKFVG